MTTASSIQYHKFPNFKAFLILFLVAIIAFSVIGIGNSNKNIPSIVTPYEDLSVQEIRVIEVVSGHAWQNHGVEVNSAFDCLGKNGSTKSFKTFGFTDKFGKNIPTNMWMCFDGFDWYAIVTTVFEKIGGDKVARLVTAYKVSKDLFPTIDDFFKYIGEKWGAVAITYSIEAGKIFLQPK